MAVHTLLAFSSIIFRVPSKRLEAKPMVIYEEYRQHAMVFTARSTLVFALATLYPRAPVYAAPLAILACHLLVDRITRLHGSGTTAVRANSARLETSSFYKKVGLLYSFYQFLAIGSILLPGARQADMAYNCIIAIQSSAFMMTLYRKRIVRGRTHMVVYSFCLLLSAFHFVRVIGFALTAMVVGTFLGRINLPRSWGNSTKYALWTAYLLAIHSVSPVEAVSP